MKNIEACKELAETTRSAYGPNGMNKMVINHLEKLFVTNDAATIMREIEVCFYFIRNKYLILTDNFVVSFKRSNTQQLSY
jgi:chaperonin GroEL (HSP60 family)